jgi:pyruvate dehydrogenase (NADP+)
VKKNIELLDKVVSDSNTLIKVAIPSRWHSILESDSNAYANRHITLIDNEKARKFMMEIGDPVTRLEGDGIPISTFLNNNLLGGVMMPGTSQYEKRSPNPSGKLPEWIPNNCTQCNQCVFVCPHAAIRPFVVTKEEAAAAPFPEQFETIKANGPELAGKRFAIQISVLDCTGCNACVEACPEAPKALVMGNLSDHLDSGEQNWRYASSLPERGDLVEKYSVRGSQFQTPLMEFSGACSGCGETPYFKLLTQLFGQRMVIANATGCSTIWGGSFPSNPYTTSKTTGRGPAWANSLFEDNAEFGFGMFVAMKHRREKLIKAVQNYVHAIDIKGDSKTEDEDALSSLLLDWLEVRDEKSDKCTHLLDKMKPLFQRLMPPDEESSANRSLLMQMWDERDMFPKVSHWITGGDGWAYDIGFGTFSSKDLPSVLVWFEAHFLCFFPFLGGLDHVEAFECNDVNVLVVDTEMYSNTGGQQSKSTPAGATQAFASGGKVQKKKPLGEMMMTYEHVYVASVALSNMAQTLQALVEADLHNGPSIVIAYAPCIQQGVRPNGLNDMFEECSLAVSSGYWPLYRYNPELAKRGQNPFILDCKKLRKEVTTFLQHESRFINLRKKDPTVADYLWQAMNADVKHRLDHLSELSTSYKSHQHPDEAKVRTVFASETGTAARIACDFAAACTESATASSMDDIDLDDLDGMTTIFFIATCGQGAMPKNGTNFMKDILARTEPFKPGTRFTVFGLGDSSYYFFCKAALDVETRMESLGATKMLPLGIGDDSAETGLDEGLHDWLDSIWPALDLPPPSEVPHITPVKAHFSERALIRRDDEQHSIEQFYHSEGINAVSTRIVINQKLCRDDYDRDFRSIRIALLPRLQYELGDAVEIFPQNDAEAVSDFLHNYSSDFGDHTVVTLHSFGVNGEISLQALFTHVMDVFGKPSRHFMQQLATFATNSDDRAQMLDPEFLKKAAKERGLTIADVLLHFKAAVPPLPALLAMIPVIKPRAYSIASSPNCSSEWIELLVLIDTWWCDAGERFGLTCNMLRQLQTGDMLWCRIKSGSMEPPVPPQPVLCAGIGSGVAPHLAFLRDRVRAAEEQKDEVAPFSLYFGNRSRVDEYLFQKELEEYDAKYPWFHLHMAFSRDDPNKKVYVQDVRSSSMILFRSVYCLTFCLDLYSSWWPPRTMPIAFSFKRTRVACTFAAIAIYPSPCKRPWSHRIAARRVPRRTPPCSRYKTCTCKDEPIKKSGNNDTCIVIYI